jgi:hypothetical protein
VLPYVVGIPLGIWNAQALLDSTHPWAYLIARNATYRYAAVGALLFLTVNIVRATTGRSPTVRLQARIVVLGTLIAFVPLIVWILSSMIGHPLRFDPTLYMSSLVLFPLAVGIAIFRYRLLEMDAIVNRTIVWGTLTAILAGMMSASVTLLQKFFVAVSGEKSDVAIILTTLILISVFTPVKSRLQAFVDRRFKEVPDQTRALRAFGGEVRTFLEMNDPREITRRLLEEAASGLQAQSGAVRLLSQGKLQTVHTYGTWRGEAWLSAPLERNGQRLGLLLIGPSEDGERYTRSEFEALQETAKTVARALQLA